MRCPYIHKNEADKPRVGNTLADIAKSHKYRKYRKQYNKPGNDCQSKNIERIPKNNLPSQPQQRCSNKYQKHKC